MKLRYIIILLCLAGWAAYGQGPEYINYQGRLVDGTNLYSGQVDMEIGLWTNASGGGTALYVDSNKVDVVDGLYSTIIGDNTLVGSLTDALAHSNVYVGVKVNGTFLPPGTLTNGTHVVKQTVYHPMLGVVWAPEPLIFEVDDSAC